MTAKIEPGAYARSLSDRKLMELLRVRMPDKFGWITEEDLDTLDDIAPAERSGPVSGQDGGTSRE